MKVLFVAATLPEIAYSIQLLESNNIDYVITGVGMLSTSYALCKKLQAESYDLIINVGIAGILDASASLGQIYQIAEDQIFEFGAEDKTAFIPIETLGFGKAIFKERLPMKALTLPNCEKAYGITVNKVHGAAHSIAQLAANFKVKNLLESMEGAAVFMVAEKEDIPVLQFRATSNHIQPRHKEAWDIPLAIKNLQLFIQKLVQSLG